MEQRCHLGRCEPKRAHPDLPMRITTCSWCSECQDLYPEYATQVTTSTSMMRSCADNQCEIHQCSDDEEWATVDRWGEQVEVASLLHTGSLSRTCTPSLSAALAHITGDCE